MGPIGRRGRMETPLKRPTSHSSHGSHPPPAALRNLCGLCGSAGYGGDLRGASRGRDAVAGGSVGDGPEGTAGGRDVVEERDVEVFAEGVADGLGGKLRMVVHAFDPDLVDLILPRAQHG